MAANEAFRKQQWKKGQRGGPGRKPGKLSMVTQLRKHFAEHPEDADAIVRNLVELAKKRNRDSIRAIREIIDRLDGKALQALELAHSGDLDWRVVFDRPAPSAPEPDDGGTGDE